MKSNQCYHGNLKDLIRLGHGMHILDDKLIMFGGFNEIGYFNDIKTFKISPNKAKSIGDAKLKIDTNTVPFKRADFAFCGAQNKWIIFGGFDGNKYYNDIHFIKFDSAYGMITLYFVNDFMN